MAAHIASTDAFTSGMLRWFDQHAAQGLFTTDCDLVVRTWNQWLVNATDLSAESVVGRPLFEVAGCTGCLVERLRRGMAA